MKPTFLLLAILGIFWVRICATAQAQEPANDEQTPLQTPVELPRWLNLAQQITVLENADPYQRDDNESETVGMAKGRAVAELERLTNQLLVLPQTEITQAYRYMLEHAKVEHFLYGSISNFIGSAPSGENVRFVKPYFEKLSVRNKAFFMAEVVLDAILLRPEVPEFRDFPRDILQKAAQGVAPSQDLVSQAALALVTYTTAAEKQLMHQALARDFKNAGLWNALTQLNDLTPAEVQKARAMFSVLKGDPGWRLTLALALSPYDARMSDLVKQAVEAELKATADIDIAAILLGRDQTEKQQQLEQSALIEGGLAALNHWELKKALPYLFRILRATNPFVNTIAMPILAMRAPQEVIRIARLPHARDQFLHLDFGVGLVGLLYPEFQSQAKQILDSGPPQDEEFKGYDQVTAELLKYGVLSAF